MDFQKPLEEYFADWESHVFGFGYGTGEAPVLDSLREFMGLCDMSYTGRYSYERMEAMLGAPVTWLLINTLCHANIIEYGTSPRFGWLTKNGWALRMFILSKSRDELVNMLNGDHDYDEPNEVTDNPFYHTYKEVKNGE